MRKTLVTATLPEHDEDPLITIGEFAARVRMTARTIHNRRSTDPDSLPQAYLIGGRLLWKESEVDAWIEQQRA